MKPVIYDLSQDFNYTDKNIKNMKNRKLHEKFLTSMIVINL